MVELQCDDVCLAAIDAGMGSEVVPQETPILVATFSDAIDLASDVCGAVPKVMRTPVRGVAGPTVVLPRTERLVLERKCPERLRESTPNAFAKRLI